MSFYFSLPGNRGQTLLAQDMGWNLARVFLLLLFSESRSFLTVSSSKTVLSGALVTTCISPVLTLPKAGIEQSPGESYTAVNGKEEMRIRDNF